MNYGFYLMFKEIYANMLWGKMRLSAGLNIQHFSCPTTDTARPAAVKLLVWGLCLGRIFMLPNEPSLSTPLSS